MLHQKNLTPGSQSGKSFKFTNETVMRCLLWLMDQMKMILHPPLHSNSFKLLNPTSRQTSIPRNPQEWNTSKEQTSAQIRYRPYLTFPENHFLFLKYIDGFHCCTVGSRGGKEESLELIQVKGAFPHKFIMYDTKKCAVQQQRMHKIGMAGYLQ